MHRTAAVLALLLTAACASTPMTSNETGGAAAARVTSDVRNAPHYIMLSAPNQVRDWDFGNAVGARGLHVRGTMTTRGFVPAGEIQGSGKFCADGRDWLSLTTLKVHKASDNQTPVAPYVLGCASGSSFQPASRAIVTQ